MNRVFMSFILAFLFWLGLTLLYNSGYYGILYMVSVSTSAITAVTIVRGI